MSTLEKVFEKPINAMKETIDVPVMEYTLSDAIRDGSNFTKQAFDWGGNGEACALSAAAIAAKAHGFI